MNIKLFKIEAFCNTIIVLLSILLNKCITSLYKTFNLTHPRLLNRNVFSHSVSQKCNASANRSASKWNVFKGQTIQSNHEIWLVMSIKRCTVSPDNCDQSDWVPSWAMTTLDNSPSSLPNSSRHLELRLFSMNHKHSVKCLFKKWLGEKIEFDMLHYQQDERMSSWQTLTRNNFKSWKPFTLV